MKKKAALMLLCLMMPLALVLAQKQGNSVAEDYKVRASDYKNDTLSLFYNLLWKKCTRSEAAYYRIAYKDGEYFHCQDYYVAERSLVADERYTNMELTQKEGLSLNFNRKGKLKMVGYYFRSLKTGWWLSYNDSSRCSDSSLYFNGVQVGRCVSFYDDGSLMQVRNLDRKGSGAGDVTFLYPSGKIKMSGHFSDSMKKDGTWTRYYPDGKISFVTTYAKDSVLAYQCYDSLGNAQQDCILNQIPEFSGGIPKLLKFLTNNLRFPRGYEITTSSERVIAQFVVDEKGHVRDVVILKPLHPKFDAEVLRVLRKMPDWKPGVQYNEPVSTYYTLPVAFRSH